MLKGSGSVSFYNLYRNNYANESLFIDIVINPTDIIPVDINRLNISEDDGYVHFNMSNYQIDLSRYREKIDKNLKIRFTITKKSDRNNVIKQESFDLSVLLIPDHRDRSIDWHISES